MRTRTMMSLMGGEWDKKKKIKKAARGSVGGVG